MMEYMLLHHSKFQDDDETETKTISSSSITTATATATAIIPSHHFLGDAVFAGGHFKIRD